jgi:hypothetical protein
MSRAKTSSFSELYPRNLARSIAVIGVAVLAGICICIFVGLLAADHRQLALGLAAGSVVATIAAVWPRLFVPGLALLLLVPYTWSPTVNGIPEPVTALVAGIGALVAIPRLGGFRANRLDYLVIGIVLSAMLSETYRQITSLGSHTVSRTELNTLLLPYLAFRIVFTAWPKAARRVPEALITTGCILSAWAIIEELAGRVLIAGSSLNNPSLSQWGISYQRGHGLRAEAAMGHPLAFGCFLVIPLVFAFHDRRWSAFALLAGGEALTLSRGPYVAALVALVLCAVLTGRAGRLSVAIVVAVVLALFVTPVGSSVTESFQSGTAEQANASYRSALLGTSLSTVTVWGEPLRSASEIFSQSPVVLKDITSELALITSRQGGIGLAVWLGLLGAFVYVLRLGRRRHDDLLMLLGIALVAEWGALLTVPLITSFQVAFWMIVALAAALVSQSVRERDEPGRF